MSLPTTAAMTAIIAVSGWEMKTSPDTVCIMRRFWRDARVDMSWDSAPFVLQGGEDEYFTDERLAYLIRSIRQAHPDCAITLSVGERSRQSYQKYFDAGADRYLLRHETANEVHYRRLHPRT